MAEFSQKQMFTALAADIPSSAEADGYRERRDSLLWEPELTPKNGHENVILKDLPPAFLLASKYGSGSTDNLLDRFFLRTE